MIWFSVSSCAWWNEKIFWVLVCLTTKLCLNDSILSVILIIGSILWVRAHVNSPLSITAIPWTSAKSELTYIITHRPFIFARFDWLLYVMWCKISGQLSRNNRRLGQHLSAGCFPCLRPKEAKPAEEIHPETSFFLFIKKLTYQPPERVYSFNSTNNTQAVTKGVFTLFQWFARFNIIFLLPTWHLTLKSIAKFALCNNG